uniref:Uncharacterized protein n=1 Tax=Mycobacterium sp. (strain KMS) TaxID=189918 RepID=A1UQD6_MYCSK
MVLIRKRLGKGDGFGLAMAALVDDYAARSVPFEHLDVGDEAVVDRDGRPCSTALCGPIDDQLVGGQSRQCPADRFEVVATFAGRGDQLNDLRQAHVIVGDLAPTAEQFEHRRQRMTTGAAQPQSCGIGFDALTHGRGVGKFDPLPVLANGFSGVSGSATRP